MCSSDLMWWLSAYPKVGPAPQAEALRAQAAQAPTAERAQALSAEADVLQVRAEQAGSYAGRFGRVAQPLFAPLGFDWQIGIGLITSLAAREVFVSTMGVVFNAEAEGGDTTPLRQAMLAAKWPDGRVLFTPLTCLTLMVFYVFAMQCISTLAVVRRETNSWRWPAFQILYLTGTAWIVCLVVYQAGRALGY